MDPASQTAFNSPAISAATTTWTSRSTVQFFERVYSVRFLIWIAIFLSLSSSAQAGLSATEVVVAVNGSSLNSRTVANHYAKLRHIPSVNIVVLDDVPDSETIKVSEFRDKILRPLLTQIEERKLANHVQCIAYSADFPTAIDISEDLAEMKDLHTVYTKVASINGLTYLYDFALRGDPSYVTPEVNFYARRPMGTYFTNPGGKQGEKAWSDILVLVHDKDFSKASQEIDKLIEQFPYQFPLKYLSAAYAAQAGQKEKALKRLDEAISAGWISGGYLSNDPQFESLRTNDQFQSLLELLDQDSGNMQPVAPFNARGMWAANGVEFVPNSKQPNLGMRYMLSTVLAVTRGLGTTLPQATESLKRSASADFTHPEGGFYFSSTLDIRTKTRRPNFAPAVDELKKLGFEAEIIVQEFPRNKTVLGTQLGSPSLDWATSRSTLVPGAIVDNLTSLGGAMTPPQAQTPLTHFIAAGAAGSSGTVTEPYSVPFKFPTPYLYLYYAQGLSLAEAFYQSVTGPYQLLIVGDPLCQPFSIAPNQPIDTQLRLIKPNGSIQLSPDLSAPSFNEWLGLSQPQAKRRTQVRATKIAVQIDGSAPIGGNLQPMVNIKLEKQSLGYHEVQVILIADDPLKQRAMQVVPVWIGPEDAIALTLNEPTKKNARTGDSTEFPKQRVGEGQLELLVQLPEDTAEVSLLHDYEVVATSETSGRSIKLSVDPKRLGLGPVRLQAKAKLSDSSTIASKPLWIEVTQ